mmetsp:Transcript_22435/g.62597  ORF Transcript_22435/g.62597 Transcript_22435/m.62597 type:complete len:202 (-) Transcript_22435:160-765(-)
MERIEGREGVGWLECLLRLSLVSWKGLAHVLPCLDELLVGGLEELVVSQGADEFVHDSLLVSLETGLVDEGVDLEGGNLLGECLHGLLGLLEVKGDGGDSLREPWLVASIWGAGVGGLAHWGGSWDAPVIWRDGTELSLATVTGTGWDVAVLLSEVQVVLGVECGGSDAEGGWGESRNGGGRNEESGGDLHGGYEYGAILV